MSRYIDADAFVVDTSFFDGGDWHYGYSAKQIGNAPTVDAVPIGAVEQIRWERDMAMQQLSEHGIPFGGKADDVIKVCRCKDCKWFQSGIDIDGNPFTRCNGSDRTYGHTEPDWFCADGERRSDD